MLQDNKGGESLAAAGKRLNIDYKKERFEKKCIVTTFTLREVGVLRNIFPPRSKDVSFPSNQHQS